MEPPALPVNRNHDEPWYCLACNAPIVSVDGIGLGGISLDDSTEPHICPQCFSRMTVAEKVEMCRKWRADRRAAELMQAATDLCRAATDGWRFPGMGTTEQN